MKTSIYLPDDLAEQVRAHGISISEVTQDALRRAIEAAGAKERVMTDIQAVAERLRKTISDAERERREAGREYGITWAREWATAKELEELDDFEDSESIAEFLTSMEPTDTDEPFGEAFVGGAKEIWEAVRPML